MHVALIPPVPDLHRYAGTGPHLILSHVVKKHRTYGQFYSKRSLRGEYIILDNSAHEHGTGNEVSELVHQAQWVGAREIVLPDVLFDGQATVERTVNALRYLTTESGSAAYALAARPRLMLVPQGGNRKEWIRCLHRLVYEWEHYLGGQSQAPVIGVSKDYDEMFPGGLADLIARTCRQLVERHWIDVHCLGWPADLWSLGRVHRRCPWVRSTDSAKPFVYARAGIGLEPGGPVPPYPKRPPDYFERPVRRADLVARNIEVFRAATSNDLIL